MHRVQSSDSIKMLWRSLLFSLLLFLNAHDGESHRQPPDLINLAPLSAVVSWRGTGLLEQVDGPTSAEGSNETQFVASSFALAEEKTHRKDPLDGFKEYSGGWNISDRHYWASVAFSAAPLFAISAIWFVGFGLGIVIIILCCFFCRKEPYGYSRTAYILSLVFLTLIAVATIIGCVVLYTSQKKFYTSATRALDHAVDQAGVGIENLQNVSEYFAAAKQVDVFQVMLPADVQSNIDQTQSKIQSSAAALSSTMKARSQHIQHFLATTKLALIIFSLILFCFTVLGFVLSIFGLKLLVHILVIIGWILVTLTFILCGVFLLLHNMTADTCVAMKQWVQSPTFHTTVDELLPCAENATITETLVRSKEVTSQVVEVINQVITNVSNINFSPNFRSVYYNQSGPVLPVLCNPFGPDLNPRTCSNGEVDLANATQVWSFFVCEVTTDSICMTVGRLTPTIYSQMVNGVNVSSELYHYAQFLVDLEYCSIMRQTILSEIYVDHCPVLLRNSKWIFAGLVTISTGVLLSLFLWVIYARERRHRMSKAVQDREDKQHH